MIQMLGSAGNTIKGAVLRLWQFLTTRGPKIIFKAQPELERGPASPPSMGHNRPPEKLRPSHFSGSGEYFFRGAILEELGTYFDILGRMRRYDPDAYSLYSRVGANLVAGAHEKAKLELEWLKNNRPLLSPWWLTNRPTFGAIAIVHPKWMDQEKTGKFWIPKFLYFSKFDPRYAPPVIQRAKPGCDVYVVTVYWDNNKDRGAPTEFAVAIGSENNISILRAKVVGEVSAAGKRQVHRNGSRGRRTRGGVIPTRRWEIGGFYKDWAGEKGLSATRFLESIFVDAANLYEAAHSSMIRVDVRAQTLHAVFGVDITRTPYFFRDRDFVAASDGRRKRIFHIVKTHERKDGKVVKLHFRGANTFAWNGYDVRITVPGRDHANLTTLDAAAFDEEALNQPLVAKTDMRGLGKLIATHIKEGWAA